MSNEPNNECTCQHGRWLHEWDKTGWLQCHHWTDGERCECAKFEAAA